MSTSATGQVVEAPGVGIERLGVVLEDVSRQVDVTLAQSTTRSDGSFALTYADDIPDDTRPGRQVRRLRLRVMLGRHVLEELSFDDLPNQATLVVPTITLSHDEAFGWWATLGTGAPSRRTEGNAVRWLIDNVDAWGRAAKVIDQATELDVMQLSIAVDRFNAADPQAEKPVLALSFDSPDPPADPTQAALVGIDQRFERLALKRYRAGSDVRILTPKPSLDKHALAVVGGALLGVSSLIALGGLLGTIVAIAIGVLLAATAFLVILFRKALFDFFSNRPAIAQWFIDAGAVPPRQPVQVKELHMRATQFTHAKMVIDRGREVVLLGSPFEQVYFDSQHHLIADPRRGGSASKGPIHDASVGVRGPAVVELQEVFNAHWNLAAPDDRLTLPERPVELGSAEADEFICTAQVVRTLDLMFDPADAAPGHNGEKGVLEAYLRAIHFAERFIYIENQYFNNDTITQALIDALAAKPSLVLILFLNAIPDMPLYPGWQQSAIDRIRGSLKTPADRRRLGVFSAWTHAPSDAAHDKPRLVDNYLHTKTAIVDNRWATVGSANLDGASLDFIQYARPVLDGDVRNSETNLVVFEPAPAQPKAVDALRRRLWSEHLGIADPNSQRLDDADGKNWLDLWRDAADQKLTGLQNNLDQVLALEGRDAQHPIQIHALPWPEHAFNKDLGLFEQYHPHQAGSRYLARLFSPDEMPSEVLLSQFEVLGTEGPPSLPFKSKT